MKEKPHFYIALGIKANIQIPNNVFQEDADGNPLPIREEETHHEIAVLSAFRRSFEECQASVNKTLAEKPGYYDATRIFRLGNQLPLNIKHFLQQQGVPEEETTTIINKIGRVLSDILEGNSKSPGYVVKPRKNW